MSTYVQRQIPAGGDIESLKRWMADELANIRAAQTAPVEKVQRKKLFKPPAKFGEGTEVLADGVQWNPGAGPGVYCYYNGAWNKLG